MPWKETSIMTERLKFIMRVNEGEKITDLCEEFGISRKTGHKIINRFNEYGPEGLYNKPRAPLRVANKTPFEIEQLILNLKRDKLSWGAPKLRELFLKKYPRLHCPCETTFHSILDKNNLTKRRRQRGHYKAQGSYLSVPMEPNDLWSADFKGHFRMKNMQYCYPLTITDNVSRYIFACDALESVKPRDTINIFERAFRENGLPKAIRTDNGVPFSHPQGLHGLSPLSVWWLSLGIKLERIEPGCPEQNGRHERMHRSLKSWLKDSKVGSNILQQQEYLEMFTEEFNNERPHEALDMKTPSEVHTKSSRVYDGTEPEYKYQGVDKVMGVTLSGEVRYKKHRIYVGRAFKGYNIGITEQEDEKYLVNFMDYEIGFFDTKSRKVISVENPFILKKL